MSEPNKNIARTRQYLSDNNTDAALCILGNNVKINGHLQSKGYVGVKTDNTLIISVYISPNIPNTEFEDIINNLCDTLRENSRLHWIVGGDFNAKARDWNSHTTDIKGTILLDAIASIGLCLLNQGDTPTFVRNNQTSFIDITLCSISVVRNITDWKVQEEEESGSDHCYITFKFIPESNQEHIEDYSTRRWKISQEDLVKMQEELVKLRSQWSTDNPEDLIGAIIKACDKTLKKVYAGNGKRRPVYWWNNSIEKLRKTCIKARRKLTRARKSRISLESLTEAYKVARKNLKHEINNSKRQCWVKICEEVNQDVWGQGYKIVTGKLGNRPVKLSEALEKHILEVLFPAAATVDWIYPDVTSDSVPPFTLEDLVEVSAKMKSKKAPGPDGILPEIVKSAVMAVPEWVLAVMNKILLNGDFPSMWKRAKVVLLPKPGKPAFQPSSYRPLCLLDTFSKLLEGLLIRRMMEELGERGLSESQFGFRPQRSTVDAIQRVFSIADEERKKSRRRRGFCLLVTLDVRNAFNLAPWKKIIESLEDKNVPTYIIKTFMSYFHDRRISTTSGTWIKTSAGAPQGSVASPTLWNMLYDGVLRLELPNGVSLVAYADDLAVVVIAKTAPEIEERTNETLNRINSWMVNHGLELAPEKSEAVLLIGRKSCGPVHIHLNGAEIPLSDNVKYLGVILDRRLSFKQHVDYVTKKAMARVEALQKIMPRQGGATYMRRKLLNSVVESTILYASPVWSRAVEVKCYVKKMVSVQRRMALSITRAYRTTSTVALQVLAGVTPIDLLITERAKTYGQNKETKQEEKENTIQRWNERWGREINGAWTRRLIPNLKPWVTRTHGNITYHLTQLLAGHGNFASYLHRFRIYDSPTCMYCPLEDTAEHIFQCPRWSNVFQEANSKLNTTLSPENLVPTMLRCEEDWNVLLSMVTNIMKQKEKDERTRRRSNM
ncbi:hypothetical protein M8J75_013476 [Diaphorina citri]|nr:hypothetical protein M8J75_013476 [Diaphorina citri]KAI5739547.1 hypothetical protein M8J77_020589 [Diaphorina citri]